MTITSAGSLIFNFPWIGGSEPSDRARDRLKKVVVDEIALDVAADYTEKWRTYKIAEWRDKAEVLKDAVGRLFDELVAS